MTEYTEDEYAALADASQAKAELAQCTKAFAAVRDSLFSIIEGSGVADAALREQMYAGLHILKRVKQALEESAAAGDLAENNAKVRAILAGEYDEPAP